MEGLTLRLAAGNAATELSYVFYLLLFIRASGHYIVDLLSNRRHHSMLSL